MAGDKQRHAANSLQRKGKGVLDRLLFGFMSLSPLRKLKVQVRVDNYSFVDLSSMSIEFSILASMRSTRLKIPEKIGPSREKGLSCGPDRDQ
jgi:hypothetical protein